MGHVHPRFAAEWRLNAQAPAPDLGADGAAIPEAQLSNAHATHAQWDDPADTRTVGSRTVRQVYGFRRVDPLITLHRRSPADFPVAFLRAAERLRDDYEMSEGARVRSGQGNGDMGIINAQMAAAARYRNAVQAVGPEPWAILRLVVLDGWTIARFAEKFFPEDVRSVGEKWTRRRLIDALDKLHLHYNPPITRKTSCVGAD